MTQPTFPHSAYDQHVLQPAYEDAQAFLFTPMLAAHEAHAVMLAECGVITQKNAHALLQAIAQVRTEGTDHLAYEPGVEDLFFRIEARIIELAGPDYGGNLQLARSRNDLGQALARMALRRLLLELNADLLRLRVSVLDLARRHLHTIMPGYTHTQPAQPVTFAHYLAGVLTFLGKDQERLAAAYANVNVSPLGAAAFTGTGFPIDRGRVAELLGFDSVITSTHHSIGAGDHITDVACAVQSLAVGLGRMTRDLLFLATKESGALRIHDSFIQISSIMPQKRNPVVLEHLRARLSRALGLAQSIVIQCHNIPYGDTQDIEDEIWPPLAASLDALQQSVQLYTAVFETLELNREHLRQRAAGGFTTATELADSLVREAGLSFRQAHQVVAALVGDAVAASLEEPDLTLDMLQEAANHTVGHDLPFSAQQMAEALDPERFVDVRTLPGGVAPVATELLLDSIGEDIRADEEWLDAAETRIVRAEDALNVAVRSIA